MSLVGLWTNTDGKQKKVKNCVIILVVAKQTYCLGLRR